MTITELKQAFKQAGWMFGPAGSDTGVDWYAYKRLEGGKDCQCNDKSPSLIATPYQLKFTSTIMESVEFSIAGEIADSDWINFKVYGIAYDEAISKASKYEAILLTAWNAVAV
jgi:hypothetical protein